MGDYFDLRDKSSNPSRVDVHEHRAPTDESIKLLNEMQEKILKNIVAQFKVDNNDYSYEIFDSLLKWNKAKYLSNHRKNRRYRPVPGRRG